MQILRLIICGSVLTAACSGGEDTTCPGIEGPLAEYNTTDAVTGDPVCDAEVQVFKAGTKLEDGEDLSLSECGFELWTGGDYSFEVTAPGYAPLTRDVTVESRCGNGIADLPLQPE